MPTLGDASITVLQDKHCSRNRINSSTSQQANSFNVKSRHKNDAARRLYWERFIYSVFTKDTLDEKGQARDTSTYVTFNALNSTKNFPVAAG